MEYILQNTDLFDEEIGTKFSKAIKSDREKFDKEKTYKLTVSFHVNLLTDSRFETFFIPEPSVAKKGSKEDKMYDVMKTQLKRIEQILSENEIEALTTAIQGDILEYEDIIKIEITEDTSEPRFTGKGKNRKRLKSKVSSIVPSLPGTQRIITEEATKTLSKIYSDFRNVIRDKKLMSEILGIEETEDEIKLIEAFCNQFGDLWLCTKEREKELINKLKERSLLVLRKYIEENKDIK